jgi:hypothetical protein
MLSLLMFTLCGAAAAQAAPPTEREVSFPSGPIELRGTLMVPDTEGPHPAVVFLHGSGPATREGARSYAEEFARMGLASLFFDKRGAGASGGSWLTSSLGDLAGDALAAFEFMQSQDGVDPARVGFWGVSQAGWVATLAASRSEDVAFMVLISGGGASPRESELFSYRQAFAKAGLAEAEEREALEVLDEYFHYLASGEGRPALVARLEEARASRWYPHARLDQILPSEEMRRHWSWVATWDPAPHITKIECPLLLLFGERDTDHPTEIAAERWREGLLKAGNDDVTLTVFPGAGHGIRMREGHTGAGRAPFADGYMETMLDWLEQKVVR